jgi:hypothetical protein
MTYRQEMARLSRELGKLLIEGGQVPGVDISAAVAGHASVVRLLRAVHADLVSPDWDGVKDLGYVLFAQHCATERPLVPGPPGPPASKAGEMWRNVTEWATAAQHEWHQSTLSSRPFGETAWSEIADTASIAEAIGQLNGDIADSLAEAGRWFDASNFRANQSGLLEIAQEVRHVAALHPLPPAPDLKPALTDHLLLVPTPEAIPQAVERLRSFITSTDNLPPAQVELISRTVTELAAAAAAALRHTGGSAPQALREFAHRLSAVAGLAKHFVPLHQGNGKAAAQAQRIHQLLRNLKLRGTTLAPHVARSVAGALPSITEALNGSVERQVAQALWMSPRVNAVTPNSAAMLARREGARMLDKLRHANDHGPVLSRAVSQVPRDARRRGKPAPLPRKVLAGPLAQRGSPIPLIRPPQALPRGR